MSTQGGTRRVQLRMGVHSIRYSITQVGLLGRTRLECGPPFEWLRRGDVSPG